jgi:hypothetical protein
MHVRGTSSPHCTVDWSTLATCHARRPPVGSVDVAIFPSEFWPPATTHNAADGHEMGPAPSPAKTNDRHARAAPEGWRENVTWRPWTATHKDALGHDTSVNDGCPGSSIDRHADAPASGACVVTTCPSASAAAQKDAVGHEIASWCTAPNATALQTDRRAPG